jgi:hypothetical protein
MIHACCAAAAIVAAVACPGAASARTQGSVSGRITYIGPSALTIQTGGRQVGVINALTRAATAITAQDLPYVWGGGHGAAGVASVGQRGGPGSNGHRVGYDCSGSVTAVLAAAGLWPAGSPVPSEAGVIRQLLAGGVIARGAGLAPNEVTLYDDPGVHIFMNIDGHFFGTSDGRGGGNRRGGAGWLDDGAPDAVSRRFKRYHVVPSVLRDSTIYGHSYTFQIDPLSDIAAGAEPGDVVQVDYTAASTGTMLANGLEYVGALTTTGTVIAVATDLATVTVQTPTGTLTLATSAVTSLVSALEIGDSVQVKYTKDQSGDLVPHVVTVESSPTPASS